MKIEDGPLTRYRCRVGHAYGMNSLAFSEDERSEEMLWAALQSLQAKSELNEVLAKSSAEAGDEKAVERAGKQADAAKQAAVALERVIDDLSRGWE